MTPQVWTPQDLIILSDAGVQIDQEILESVAAYVVHKHPEKTPREILETFWEEDR